MPLLVGACPFHVLLVLLQCRRALGIPKYFFEENAMGIDNLTLVLLGSMVWFLIASASIFGGEALITLFFHGRLKLAGKMFGGAALSPVVFLLSLVLSPHKQGSLAPFCTGIFFLISLALLLASIFMPTIIAVNGKIEKTKLVILLNVLGLVLPFCTFVAYIVALKQPKPLNSEAGVSSVV